MTVLSVHSTLLEKFYYGEGDRGFPSMDLGLEMESEIM